MKNIQYLLVLLLVFTACKSKKNMIDNVVVAKKISAKKVVRKHIAANFNKKTLDSKLKVNFNNGKTKQSLTVSLKIIKDEVIYLKGSKFITVFKAKITPTKVSYYSPFAKNYFEGDFSMIKDFLGVEINFEQLQNLFLGQSLQNVKEEKQDLTIVNNSYVLSPEKQSSLFNIFFSVNPSHFKLDNQYLVNSLQNQRLDISYPSYNLIEDEVFPTSIKIIAKQASKFTNIDLTYKSVEFNKDVNMSFSIPGSYKRLNF